MNPRLGRSSAALVLVIGAVGAALCGAGAQAHGGEDHCAAPPPPSVHDAMRSATTTTTAVELVLRWPAQEASTGAHRFLALLSHAASNAPIEAATLDAVLSAPGRGDVRIPLLATASPGIYAGEVVLPVDGSYALAITVVAGDLVEVLALPTIEIGPPNAPATAAQEGGGVGVAVAVVSAAVLLIALLALALVLRRRRQNRRGLAAMASVVLLTTTMATAVRAHGGEDHSHGDEAKLAAASTGTTSAGAAPTVGPGRVFMAKESQFLLGVRTVVAGHLELAERLAVSGVVSAPPERHAAVFVPQSGRISPPGGGFAQLGAPVKKGQLLGTVDAVISASERAAFLAEESRARADAGSLTARLEAARKSLARLEALSGVASQQEIEAARVEVSTATAELEGARARIGAFSTSSGGGTARYPLVAPLDGVLADVDVSPGEVLEQGRRAFLIVDPRQLTIEAKVPEHELARLANSTEAVVAVDAYPGRSFAAKLIAEGQVIDEATRTAKVIFSVENPSNALKLGMFAQVQIGAGAERMTLAIPDAAILDIDGRRVVYVHPVAEEFEQREVQLGRRDGDMVEVLRGLEAGERVVVVGGYTLKSAAK